jgi:hypothetical protein
MATELPVNGSIERSSDFAVKAGLARMLQGGVIMDVVNAEQVLSSPTYPSFSSADGYHAGPHRRRSRSSCRHGARARSRRYQSPGWRGTHERSKANQGDHGGGDDSRDGEGTNWALCRMPGTPLSSPLPPSGSSDTKRSWKLSASTTSTSRRF